MSSPEQNASVKGFPACSQHLLAASSKATSGSSPSSVPSSKGAKSLSDSLIVLILSTTQRPTTFRTRQ